MPFVLEQLPVQLLRHPSQFADGGRRPVGQQVQIWLHTGLPVEIPHAGLQLIPVGEPAALIRVVTCLRHHRGGKLLPLIRRLLHAPAGGRHHHGDDDESHQQHAEDCQYRTVATALAAVLFISSGTAGAAVSRRIVDDDRPGVNAAETRPESSTKARSEITRSSAPGAAAEAAGTSAVAAGKAAERASAASERS